MNRDPDAGFLSFTELSATVGDKIPQANKHVNSGLFLMCNTRKRSYLNCDKTENRQIRTVHINKLASWHFSKRC